MSGVISFGFDCDVPRGAQFIKTPVGARKLSNAIKGLQIIQDSFGDRAPRSYFICGEHLETLVDEFGRPQIRALFAPAHPLVEIGNHTWSHSVLAAIPSRPDKAPLALDEIRGELKRTNEYTREILGDVEIRGVRSPLGHPSGLRGAPEVTRLIKSMGFDYVTSDIRCARGGIEAPLLDVEGHPRAPYRYRDGLLEIPSHGWHDTAFSGESKTPYFSQPPAPGEGVTAYYARLIEGAAALSEDHGAPFCLTFVMHPAEIATYAAPDFFEALFAQARRHDMEIVTFGEIERASRA